MLHLKQCINRWWVKYHQVIQKVIQSPKRASIFDPGFLFRHYYNRNLLIARKYVSGTLLDVGCGNRSYADILAPNVQSYIGLDYPSVRSVHLLNMDFNPPNIWGDAHFLPIKSACIDTIVSLEVLEHLPEPDKAIAEMWRVLKNGGITILTTPGLYPIHGPPYDYYRYTEYGLTLLLEKNGFQVIKILRNGSYWAYMGFMLNSYIFSYFFEHRQQYSLKVVLGAMKVLLTPLIIAIVACVNVLFFVLDKTHNDPYVTSNYMVIASSKRASTRGRKSLTPLKRCQKAIEE